MKSKTTIYFNNKSEFVLVESINSDELGGIFLIPPVKFLRDCKQGEFDYWLSPEDILINIEFAFRQNKSTKKPFQKEIAKHIGMTQQHLSRIINGISDFPRDMIKIKKLIDLFLLYHK